MAGGDAGQEVEGPDDGISDDHGLKSNGVSDSEVQLSNHLENWLPFNDCTSGSGIEDSNFEVNDDSIIKSHTAETDSLAGDGSDPRICLDVGHARGELGANGDLSSSCFGPAGSLVNCGLTIQESGNLSLGCNPDLQYTTLGTASETQASLIPDLLLVPFAATQRENPILSPSSIQPPGEVSEALAVVMGGENLEQNPGIMASVQGRKTLRTTIHS